MIGSGICALPFSYCKPWIRWAAAGFGFLGGIAPDAISWLGGLFGGDEFAIKEVTHNGALAEVFIYHPAYALHLFLDSIVHPIPDWWSTYGWLEILCWVIGALMLWEVFRRK